MEVIEYYWKRIYVQDLFELKDERNNDLELGPNLNMFIRRRRKDEYCLTFNQGTLKIIRIYSEYYSRLETIIHLPNTSSHFERQNRHISRIGSDIGLCQ